MILSQNQYVFFELLNSGLWEKKVSLSQFKDIDYTAILQLAEEQSVVGLVTAGIEKVEDVKVPKEVVLLFVGSTLQIEQRNKAMNDYVAKLIDLLRNKHIYTILVKGQGIAQCYEMPLWRASGDVDLLLSEDNYEEAKKVLIPFAVNVESEYRSLKHLGMEMPGGFEVELHGLLHTRLSKRIDKVIDKSQKDVLIAGNVRSWQNGRTQVFLPSPNNDIIFVFTHILNHLFIEGVGLRQICDWCRLLWTYRETLDKNLLELRIKEAGITSEWKVFAALAVNWLGMPVEAIPLYSFDKRWSRKADKILGFVLESGNFGHNRMAAQGKIHSGWLKTKDFARHALVFPWDSMKFYFHFVRNGIKIATQK